MDAISDELLLALTNDALREAMNRAGDNAWFLRKTVAVTMNAPPTTTTMPSSVRRLYRLERVATPGTYIEWTLVRYGSAGELVIQAVEAADVLAHYLELPIDLAALLDETPFPWQHEELIVVMVNLRIAQSQGSEQWVALLTERKERLMRVFLRDCLSYERMRMETLDTSYSRESWAASIGRMSGFPYA